MGETGPKDDLAALFALARAEAPEPPAALVARVRAAAVAAQGGPEEAVGVQAAPAGRGWAQVLGALWPRPWAKAGGLACAGALGFLAGFAGLLDAAPLPVGALAGVFATSAAAGDDAAALAFPGDGPAGVAPLLGAAEEPAP